VPGEHVTLLHHDVMERCAAGARLLTTECGGLSLLRQPSQSATT